MTTDQPDTLTTEEKYTKLVELVGEFYYDITGLDEPISTEEKLEDLYTMAKRDRSNR